MATPSVSKTKIIPPRRRAELLARKRLLDFLFGSLDRKLILVSAPAGYGKTSLLIDLASQSEYKCCWFSLDELDREPQRFITYLLASIAEQFPGFGHQTATVLGELKSFEHEMEQVAVMLANEVYDLIHEHFVLILDDFHILEGAQLVHDFLNRFLQLMDDNCHVVIASRLLITSLNDLPLMVARDQVSGLSFSDLAFRTDEIQALILQNNKIHISDDEAQKLIDEAEGWITGLQFSGVNFSRKDITKPILSTGVGLFDYLGQQVLDRQKPEVREFLLRTSIMEEFDAALCEAVLAPFYEESQDWDALIEAVIQNNLFALPVGLEGRSLRYHHLFRDYLRTRLERERKDEINPILIRLGQAYEAMGEWEKAHYIIKQLGDIDALAGVIERASYFMLLQALPTVEGWLNDLPPSIIKNHPGVISTSGAIRLIKGDLQEGVELLGQAVQLFREQENNRELALALTRRAAGFRYLGDYPASICDADEAIQLTEEDDTLQIFHAEALRVKGLSLYRFGEARQSLKFFEHSLEIFTRLGDRLNIPNLLVETGMAYQTLGNYNDASVAYKKALQIWRQDGNIWSQAGLLNNMGYLYQQMGDYEKSAAIFEEGLSCAQRSHHTRVEALISIGLGDLYTELQDFEVARQSYQHAEALLQERQDLFLLFSLQLGQANLALLKGETANVDRYITSIMAMVKSNQSHYENGYLDFTNGRLQLVEGNISKATRMLESAKSHFEQDGREIETGSSRVWLAAAYNAGKKHAAAMREIKEMAGNKHRKVDHATLVAIDQAHIWLSGLEKDPENKSTIRGLFTQAERIVSKFPALRREIHRQARMVPMPTPRLYIQAFGTPIVRVGGKVLSISDWQSQSVRDLFFFFLTRSRPLTKEQVGGMLWPELEEPAKVNLRFKNQMYRLRRAVGQEVILFDNPFYSFNRKLDYEYDVEAFESYLYKAKAAQTSSEQIEYYRKAVDLVHGPFLEDMDWEEVLQDRERLQQLFLNALLALAELYQKQARLEEALTMCQRAVEHDPIFEAAYCLSMQVYHRLGDRSSIIRTYQACVVALEQHLSLPPSKETEDLYRQLVS